MADWSSRNLLGYLPPLRLQIQAGLEWRSCRGGAPCRSCSNSIQQPVDDAFGSPRAQLIHGHGSACDPMLAASNPCPNESLLCSYTFSICNDWTLLLAKLFAADR